ncbi:MAG TPA: sulfatase-like hydrolase/transferase [Chiayiivirga sp.]|nr:sulfatase-like hydrolase/transferase [Chiayiivirga sp.]
MKSAHRKPSRHQRGWLALALLLVTVLLMLPVGKSLHDLGWDHLYLAHLLASITVLTMLALLPSALPKPVAIGLMSLALIVMLVVRLSFYGLVQFAGAGFTNEVFIHLEPKSFAVAWEQYRFLCITLILALASVPWLSAWLCRTLPRLRTGLSWVAIILLAAIAFVCRQGLPEWMLGAEAYAWYAPKPLELAPQELQRWRQSGLVEVDLPAKNAVQAHASKPPRNLILIYVESLGRRVIEHPDYPNLMPHLSARLKANGLLQDYFAASYITIEGITNSQCGTLFPLDGDSETMAGFDGVAERQACLGDVLHRAGYIESYLGGAETSFAGKGHFLASHGYDTVMGFDQWREQGYEPRPGGWGLGDPDLFDESWKELQRLEASGKPFNLTLLTIGTHLPGFTYAECMPYGSDEPFIEALHCSDQLLEKFLKRVEDSGFLDHGVVVLTGDHHVFPNPKMKALFGADAINDRRLPLLVLHRNKPRAAVASGASYDLAPTVLDLLGVEHTARFALGRSLLRADSARDYFPTRYNDVYQGKDVTRAQAPCSVGAPSIPMGSCDRASFLTLLRAQNAHFSSKSLTQLSCDNPAAVRVRIPQAAKSPLEIRLDGQDEAARFIWSARGEQQDQSGLFLLALSPDDSIVQRLFTPAAEALTQTSPPSIEGADHYLAVWRSDTGRSPSWLKGLGSAKATSVLIDAHGDRVPLPVKRTPEGLDFELAEDACVLWQDEDASEGALAKSSAQALADAAAASNEAPFCPIEDWGPKQVHAGERFNEQADGSSAFWFKTACAPARVMLDFDGQLIEMMAQPPVITAAINADRILMGEGTWPLQLYDPETRLRQTIGSMQVLPARKPINLPSPPKRDWPAVVAAIAAPRLIAHAGGGLNAQPYLNSLEALTHNYALGHRVFELDFNWTRDDQIVLIHDWDNTWKTLFPQANHAHAPSLPEFLSARMIGDQTPLDLPRLHQWMRSHPDAYVVTDIHARSMLGLKRIKDELGDVQARIIPQMYHAFRYPEIRALGFDQIIFTLYASSMDTQSILDFVRKTPLFAVTLNPERGDAGTLLHELHASQIPAYVHTFNEVGDMARFEDQGAYGLYTDFLYLGKDRTVLHQ